MQRRSLVAAALALPALARIGALPRPVTPGEFRAILQAKVGKWAEAVRLTGATVE